MSKLFNKTIFGLDISDFSIEVLEFDSKKEVKHFGRVALDEGIVRDGFIIDKRGLAQKIKEVTNQAGIKTRRVILSLPESKVFTHVFRVPAGLKKKELANAVGGEVEKTIPLELEKIYWSYQVISPQLKDGKHKVLFVGTLKEVIDDYMEVLNDVGLEPVALEVESIALSRALLGDLKLKAGVIIVDIGARVTNISVFDRNKTLRDSVTIPIAGNRFTKAIARRSRASLERAEKLKKTYGLDEKKGRGRIAVILRKEMQPILEKIEKAIDYQDQDIQEIFLVGGSARIPKIANHFSLNLGFRASVGISALAGQLKKKSVLFNTVIGLALRGLENDPGRAGINLLPKKDGQRPSLVGKKTGKRKIYTFTVIGFFIIALIFLAWVTYNYVFIPVTLEAPPPKEISLEEMMKLPPEEEPVVEEEEEFPPEKEVVEIIIQKTETGWLNVRKGPGTDYSVLTKVYPGESYPLLAEMDNWYKIELVDEEGWIAVRYATTIK